MPSENEVYVPLTLDPTWKGWVKPSCENCVEDHIECAIMAILRDHLVEYYQNSPGHVESPEEWEQGKIDFAQWHCSRWRLDTEASRKEATQRSFTFAGLIPPGKITAAEQAKPSFQKAVMDYKLKLLSEGIWLKEADHDE